MSQFSPTPRDQQRLKIARFLPTGKAWDGATDASTNMGKLIKALGFDLYRLELLIQLLNTELDINKTDQLIVNYETSYGIPDDCFSNTGDLDVRRQQILTKLRNRRIQTAQDYIDLAAEFGETITVTSGAEEGTFPLTFPINFFTSKASKFSIIVNFSVVVVTDSVFPLPFPFEFIGNSVAVVQCLLEKIKPANVKIFFTYT